MQPNTAMPNKFPGGANGGFGTGFQARQQSAKRYPAFERQSQKEKKHRLMRDLPIFGRSRPIFVCKRRAIDAIDESASVTCRYTARPPLSYFPLREQRLRSLQSETEVNCKQLHLAARRSVTLQPRPPHARRPGSRDSATLSPTCGR